MLTIKTMKNNFTNNSSNKYCFRTISSQKISVSELAAEMTNYNSTFTQADCEGLLSILNTIAKKYLTKGYSMELPFCTIRIGVSGTCENIQDSFSPGYGDNQITYHVVMSDSIKKEVNNNLEYKQITPETTGNAHIYQIYSLMPDATESTDLTLSAGDNIRIRGKNLSFDYADSKQGVVLQNENEEYKINKFTRIGTNVIDFTLPSDMPTGQYTVLLTTKPGINKYTNALSDSVITIN